jgi:Domain of unknown function (DUF4276)
MSQTRFIAPIVEGHGEVQALPVLLRRLASNIVPEIELHLNPALRVKVASFLNEDDGEYFEKYIELAARKAKAWPKSCVLILLDCEDSCPAQLGPKILQRAINCRSDVTYLIVLAHREYETWFLASAESLRGVCSLPVNLEPPQNAESIRNAKGWLSEKMPTPYNEPEHQPRMTSEFDFDQARQTHSFNRAYEKLMDFLGH